jgi:molecular chaperone HtpG
MAKKQTGSREQGTISIHTENIFPIIKKWLYSDKEIFLRELVANAVDAIRKLQHVNAVEGLQLAEEYAVEVLIDAAAGTLTVRDNGIGMDADEVRRYINQIAFSSAEEFLQKYQDLNGQGQIIGHFGLGFYSAFMVAESVEIRTRSYRQGATGVHWRCDGTTSYTLEALDLPQRGTEVILHLNADEREFLEPHRVRQVLHRYCGFLPVAIRFAGEVVNDRTPLWTRTPGELNDEDYRSFYAKLYPLAEPPLFWIHLNVDYPFNLRGVLFFPRLATEFDAAESRIKLFCNQVFVTDNCPELIPEFLVPLQGCLDAPDLPLNVSRSMLQNEPQVRKIQELVAGRVAGKLVELAKGERASFGEIWKNIHAFVKFGMMRDEKFYEKLRESLIFPLAGSQAWTTLAEYLDRAKDRHAGQIYYATNEAAQATYLRLLGAQGIEVIVLDAPIDAHFLQFLEFKQQGVRFTRVDAEVTENLLDQDAAGKLVSGDDGKSRDERIRALFADQLAGEQVAIRVESLKDETVPAMVLTSEQGRRLQEMARFLGDGPDRQGGERTLLINTANPVIRNLMALHQQGREAEADQLVAQVYDLAMLSCQAFDRERMERFLERSHQLLARIEPGGKVD